LAMRIYALSIGNKIRKGLTVKKHKGHLKFLSFQRKSNNNYISIFYPDIVYTTVNAPLVEDAETLEFLIKTKISGFIEEGKEYILLYFPKEKISENEALYDVYALPEDTFYHTIKELNISPDSVSLFSVDVFSLIPISTKIDPNVVFHFYSDEEKILISVSSDGTPLYVRSMVLPENMEPQEFVNFCYENFNLTYLYVYQNKKIDISTVVVSGKGSQYEQLLKLIQNQTSKEPVIPQANDYITGISQEDFMEYLIPVGTALLEERHDISPLEIKKVRAISKITRVLSGIFLAVALVATLGTIFSVFTLQEKRKKVEELKRMIYNSEDLSKNLFSSKEIQYFTELFRLKEISNKTNPLYLFKDLFTILELVDENRIAIANQQNKQVIEINGENQFDTLRQMVFFENQIKSVLGNIKNYKITKNIVIDEKNFVVRVYIKLEKEINGI